MVSQTSTIVLTNGLDKIGVDKILNLVYYMYMIRTYMMYAGLTFLGYEYGETEEAVVFRTVGKFGPPKNWNETEYKAKLIVVPELEKV